MYIIRDTFCMYKLFYNVVYMLTELYIDKRKNRNTGLAHMQM